LKELSDVLGTKIGNIENHISQIQGKSPSVAEFNTSSIQNETPTNTNKPNIFQECTPMSKYLTNTERPINEIPQTFIN
jgi:hypothetical protein